MPITIFSPVSERRRCLSRNAWYAFSFSSASKSSRRSKWRAISGFGRDADTERIAPQADGCSAFPGKSIRLRLAKDGFQILLFLSQRSTANRKHFGDPLRAFLRERISSMLNEKLAQIADVAQRLHILAAVLAVLSVIAHDKLG